MSLSLLPHHQLISSELETSCTHIGEGPSAGQVVWCSHLFKNFPQFIVIHTVKGFSIVNEVEVDVFWNFLVFSMIQWMLAI